MNNPCYFKHVETGETLVMGIKPETKINELKTIFDTIASNLMIRDNNYEIVISGLSKGERADPINLLSTKQFKSLKNNVFYVRPKDIYMISNFECKICYETINLTSTFNWISCSHYSLYCQPCISNWYRSCLSNDIIPSCPLCRQNIRTN
jgi:hypothetical protein